MNILTVFMYYVEHYVLIQLFYNLSLNTDKLKATKKFKKEEKEVWMAEKRKLCGKIYEQLGIRVMEIGRNATGGGLTGTVNYLL